MIPLALSIILLGAQAVLVQVLLIRETLAVYFGNELTIGIVFFSWLAGVAVGASTSTRWSGRLHRPALALLVLQGGMTAVPMCQVWLVRIVRIMLGTPSGELVPFPHVLGSALCLIAPFGLLVGMAFPVACTMWKKLPGRAVDSVRSIGVVYSLEALGALAGGVLYTFYLVTRIPSFSVLIRLALIVWSIGVWLAVAHLDGKLKRVVATIWTAAAVCAVAALATSVPARLEAATVAGRWRSFGQPGELIVSRDSKYQNLALSESEGQFSLFTNGRYAWSFPDKYGASLEAHLVMCQHPDPRRVLLLGATPDFLVEVLRYPVETVDYVQLDPEVLHVVRPYLEGPLLDAVADPRVNVHYADGRQFVKRTRQVYDIVAAELPDPSTAAFNRFYTREFFREIRERLQPGGVFTTRIGSAVGYLGDEVLPYSGSVFATLRSVFDYVAVTPGTVHRMFASATDGVVSVDARELARRFDRLKIESPYFTRYHFELYVPEDRTQFVQDTYGQAENLPVNTDTNPVTYFYNMVLWDRFSGGRWAPWLVRLHGSGRFVAGGILAVMAASVGLAAIIGRRRPAGWWHRRMALTSIFTTGVLGMSIDIFGLYVFQIMFGYVYQEAGLIVAVFMMGLTLGGLAGTTIVGRASRPARWLLGTEIALLTFIVAFPLLAALAAAAAALAVTAGKTVLVTTILAGAVLVGLQFPIANHCFVAGGGKTHQSAALTEAADHGGACLGALTAGVVLVPLFGVSGACMAVMLLKLCSTVLLALGARKQVECTNRHGGKNLRKQDDGVGRNEAL